MSLTHAKFQIEEYKCMCNDIDFNYTTRCRQALFKISSFILSIKIILPVILFFKNLLESRKEKWYLINNKDLIYV